MLLTQQQLSVMCEICCEFFCLPAKQYVSLLRAHNLRVSVSHFSLLKRETPTLIWSGLLPQHPDVNSVNYNICTEMQQQVYPGKVHNVHEPTL